MAGGGIFRRKQFMKKIKTNKGEIILVDNTDFAWLKNWRWHLNEKGYATRFALVWKKKIDGKERRKRKVIKMHRLIMGVKIGLFVDHIDGNPRNNQRANLRICTTSQNLMNMKKQFNKSSKYKGVFLPKGKKKWRAFIKFNYKSFAIGSFETEKEAAKAYDQRAKELFGSFAHLNFPTPKIYQNP